MRIQLLSNFVVTPSIHAILSDMQGATIISKLQRPAYVALGTVLSVIAAILTSVLFGRSSWRGLVPLAFVAVLLILAKKFGVTVSLTGSIAAAVVFAGMLFAPLGSTKVQDYTARMNLGWMIVGSVALSYLLFPERAGSRGHDKHDS